MNDFKTIYDTVLKGLPARFEFEAEGEKYIRHFTPKERLILLGGGHIAEPLCKYGDDLGFSVVVCDDRPTFANTHRFPEAARVICDSFPNAIKELKITDSDYVCVITRGHRYDTDCLRGILSGTYPYYLGMIGSKRRVGGVFRLLKEEGFDPEKIDKICSPIGLDINALTVKEIAISIIGELISFRRRNTKRSHDGTRLITENIDMKLLEYLANDEKPKSLLIVYDSIGSTPVKSGAMMAVDEYLNITGSIGGGCSEHAVMMDAHHIIGTGQTKCVPVDMTNDIAEEEGMVCGGKMKVYIQDMSLQHMSD